MIDSATPLGHSIVMKIRDTDIVRACRAWSTVSLYCVRQDNWYLVKGEYTDLIDRQGRIVVDSDCGGEIHPPKVLFWDFQEMTYGEFKKLSKFNK